MNNETIRPIGDVNSGMWDTLTIRTVSNFGEEFGELIERPCATVGCDLVYKCERAMVQACRHCVRCCDKWERDNLLESVDQHWRFICPKNLRETDLTHEGFPRHVWNQEKGYTGIESLFLYGPTRAGKTRLATQLVREALIAKQTCTMVWPEELKEYAKGRDRLTELQRIGKHDVILLDDALLTGAQDERIADFLKDLIDFIMRNGKRVIITSQVGGKDYADQADKFGNLTPTDRKRIDALIERINEECRVVAVVPLADLPPPIPKEMF